MSRSYCFGLASAVGAAKDFVAVGKAAEPLYHCLMIKRKLREAVVAKAADKPNRFALVGLVFAVFERQIEEQPFVFAQAGIETARYNVARNRQRNMIGSKAVGVPPKHIPWNLVKQDNGGKRSFGIARERVYGLAAERLAPGGKVLGNRGVKIGSAAEPVGIGMVFKPETQQYRRPIGRRHGHFDVVAVVFIIEIVFVCHRACVTRPSRQPSAR